MTNHLFDSSLFDESLFDGGGTVATVYSTDSVAFENFSLNDGSSIVLTDYPRRGPSREVLGGPIPRDDGQYVTGSYFREAVIELRGYLMADTAAEMATLIDSLCQTLSVQEGELDITEDDGTVKRYLATCVNYEDMFGDRQRYHLTLVPFTLRFVCKTPFAKARDYTSNYVGLTTSGNQAVYNAGTYRANPVFVLIFLSASSVTGVTVENITTGESVTFTGTIAAGDVLQFDGETKEVYLNGVAQDYGGTFPKLETGGNLISYTVSGTSFTADVTEQHKNTFIR